MTDGRVEQATLSHGLTVLVESMPAVESAAFTLLLPAGCLWEQAGKNGVAALLSDLILRGAGDYSSRELAARFDELGVQAGSQAGTSHLSLSGSCLANRIEPILDLLADVVLRPHLPEDQFEGAASGVEQTLLGLEDEPRERAMVELRRLSYGDPWGRCSDGSLVDLPNIEPSDVAEHYRRCVRPNGAILGIAGRVDPSAVIRRVEAAFANWAPVEGLEPPAPDTGVGVKHLPQESAQTQIALACPGAPLSDPDYYALWALTSVLSGGMSSRLFTEVREKRGLCYSVYASLDSVRTAGRVLCYAGTTTARAQETLDVLLAELQRLREGIEPAELDRCKALAKSSLIMSQESTGSRAGSLARDWHHLGRTLPLEEIRRNIEVLTADRLLQTLDRFPLTPDVVLTMGAAELKVRRSES